MNWWLILILVVDLVWLGSLIGAMVLTDEKGQPAPAPPSGTGRASFVQQPSGFGDPNGRDDDDSTP